MFSFLVINEPLEVLIFVQLAWPSLDIEFLVVYPFLRILPNSHPLYRLPPLYFPFQELPTVEAYLSFFLLFE